MHGSSSHHPVAVYAYRIALTASILGLLASIGIAYVDLFEEKGGRLLDAAALGLSSMALGGGLILARTVLNRHQEMRHRIDAVETPAPQSISTAQHQSFASADPGLDDLLGRALDLLSTAPLSADRRAAHARLLLDCEAHVAVLRESGSEDAARRLERRAIQARRQLFARMRQAYLSCIRHREWATAFESGEQIIELFPGTSLASHARSLNVEIARRMAGQIDAHPENQPAADSSERAVGRMHLQLADQVAEPA
jgi:hypothetical protein